MPDEKLAIELIKFRELPEFLKRPGIFEGQVIPTSRLRGAAHAANPCADPDAVAFMLATRGGRYLAYVGFMPGRMRVDDKLHDIVWYSTWYAAPDPEGAAAGGVLLHASLRLGLDIVTTGLDPKTFEYYHRLRFKSIGPLEYYELDFDRIDPLGLPLRLAQVFMRRKGHASPIVDAGFLAGRRVSKRLIYGFAELISANSPDVSWQELNELPEDARSDWSDAPVAFERTPEIVRWSLKHPWIADDKTKSTPGYAFSDLREKAEFKVVEAYRRHSGERLGYLILSIVTDRGVTTVKALDSFLSGQNQYEVLFAAAMHYARQHQADRVNVPSQCKAAIERSWWLKPLFRLRQRHYFCHTAKTGSVLAPVLDRIKLSYCDGDTPFT